MILKEKKDVLAVMNSIKFGEFFTVKFVKRNSKEERVMNCRTGVKKHLKGGKMGYNPTAYDLISVWDVQAHKEKGNGYRTIPLEGVSEIKAHGEVWKFV